MMRLILTLLFGCLAFAIGSAQLYRINGEKTVAILGDAISNEKDEAPLNTEILGILFNLMRSYHPNAVFFGGNLTDVGNRPAKEIFKKQLDLFTTIEKNELGFSVPFYPVMGNTDALVPGAAQIFGNYFGIKNVVALDTDQLVYTVPVGDAFFVVLATDFFDTKNNRRVEHQITKPVLDWLEKELKNQSAYYRYLFVIGHEPAFSTTAVEGINKGLDNDPVMRDRFWDILKDNHVLAYFCSHEHLYDRTFRDGVWQIISGGAGAPLNKKEILRAFYHFLLVSIPSELGKYPRIKVIDIKGKVRDEFILTPEAEHPIFQFRISMTPT